MIKVEPCRGCGRLIIPGKVSNLDVRLEATPLDAQEAVTALLAGFDLWRVTATSLTSASPAVLGALRTAEPGERPLVHPVHVCEATGAALTASQGVPRATAPKARSGSPVAPSRPFSGPSTVVSGVLVAVNPPSDPEADLPVTARRPSCDTCLAPCEPGTYTGIMLGGTWIYVWHETCRRP